MWCITAAVKSHTMEFHCENCHQRIPQAEYDDNAGLCDECFEEETTVAIKELDDRT